MLLDYFGLWYRLRAGASAAAAGRRRKYFIERDGKILLFKNANEAAAFLTAEKTPAKLGNQQKSVEKRVKQPEIVDLPELKRLAPAYGFGVQLDAYVVDCDWVSCIDLLKRLQAMRDEEDVELLLMAA